MKGIPVEGIRYARQHLSAAGLRPTRQRLALHTLIFGNGPRHTTAEELFAEARHLRLNCSLATIYNTLHQFEKAGMVREVASYGGKLWYDTTTGPHCHFYDVENGRLFDIPADRMPEKADIPAPEGMEIVSVDVVVRVRPIPANG